MKKIKPQIPDIAKNIKDYPSWKEIEEFRQNLEKIFKPISKKINKTENQENKNK